ncbi:tetratricopeptide (TPR) repeat protein [Dokdonella fugitiva]|uniref:Tetratricopeptide (TPR) repeat protein n=1 Tax=Dokdonella fugitiva TaxID=328517 RepID=A0A839F4P7_9GAMM|nr:tetratricopeptide repeat protein [Dokdonella fugitiva]MBA8887171.1 tetratricopeptide (TPR) repeat protein [Dokdonella fugitiva]
MLQPSSSSGGSGGNGVGARAPVPGDGTPTASATLALARFGTRTGLALIILVAAVLVAYANALSASYQFDDFAAILAHPSARSLAGWWHALPGIRPLLKLGYALTFDLGGGAVAIHATNIAIHAANACLLWALWRRWLPRLAPSLGRVEAAAWLAAVLFALHPAATEAVTYASGRSISLAATFVLAAVLADDVARERPSRRALAWIGPVLFALALAVRETALVMPAIPLLRAWARGDPLRATLRSLWPYALVLAAAALAAIATPGYHVFFGVSLSTRSLAGQAMGQLLAHAYLITHSLAGATNIDPDLRVPAAWSGTLSASLLLLATLVATMLAARRRLPWLAFAIGWYFLQLAPANSLLPRLDLANDRHVYLALAGPMLALACVFARAAGRAHGRVPAGVAACMLCATFAVATWKRNADYRSEVALWQATVRDSPRKARAWLNLGYAYRLDGDAPRAAGAYRCALALDPANAQALIDLDLVAPGDTTPATCAAATVE